jgi:hypothetical protein
MAANQEPKDLSHPNQLKNVQFSELFSVDFDELVK